MSIRDRIDEIVSLLREAELDDTVWPAASALIDETCGLRGNDLLFGRFLEQGGLDLRLRWLLLHGEPNAELEREYLDYAPIDERLAPAARLPCNCPAKWVTFSCSGVHTSKSNALRMYDSAQLAFVTGRTVQLWVDDTRNHNGHCFVSRIDVEAD